MADLSSAPVQRTYLADALSLRFPGLGEAAWPDWRSLLRALLAVAPREARRRLVREHLPQLLLGEVRWHDQPVAPEALERIHRELLAKNRPPVGDGSEEVVRAVFVPRTKEKPRSRLPFLVFDADAVVEAIG